MDDPGSFDASLLAEAKKIFLAVCGLPLLARDEALSRLCEGRADLKRLVEDLLAGQDRALPFDSLSDDIRAVADAMPTAMSDPAGAQSTIGRYTLLERLGEGGFGIVYLAEQTEPVRRRVALKIIKLGMDTRQVIARFEAERQALAMMDHPGIARVIDAGATDTGRPYFVMELVRGKPITTYADDHRLSIAERLGLFRDVCEAVQHAHRKGIIHRDIKPSNVLVTLIDGREQVKIIDFGIAKAMNAKLTEKTIYTEFRQMIGTPEYMSPEQAEPGGQDVDTRTDVYSLGVLLYELLAGTLPFDSKRLRSAAYGEMQRIIREEDPPRPSTRLLQTDERASIAVQRRIEPAELGSVLRSELDWVVLKCLEKQPSRRYESASDVAAEIVRYLRHEAIEARPPSRVYRARKFASRHRVGVSVAVLVLVLLLAGIAGTSWGLVRAIDARGQAERAFVREAEAREAEALRADEAERERSRADAASRAAEFEAMVANIAAARAAIQVFDPGTARRHLELVPEPARDFEHRLLSAAVDQSVLAVQLPGDRVVATVHPAGHQALCVTRGGSTVVVDLDTGAIVHDLGFSDAQFNECAYSPDATLMAAGSRHGQFAIWDAQSGALVYASGPRKDRSATPMTFNADGSLLLFHDVEGLHVFDIARQRIVRVIAGVLVSTVPRDHVPDLIALRREWDSIVVLDGTTLDERFVLPREFAQRGEVCALSPDRSIMAFGYASGRIALVDVATRERVWLDGGHENHVHGLTFSSDGSTLLTYGADSTLIVWDVHARERRHVLRGHRAAVCGAMLVAGGAQILSCSDDRTIRLWDRASGLEIGVWSGPEAFITSGEPDAGRTFLLTGSADAVLRVWRADAPAAQATHRTGPPPWTVATVGDDRVVLETAFETRVINAFDGSVEWVLPPSTSPIEPGSVDAAQARVVLGRGGGAGVFSIATGQLLADLDTGSAAHVHRAIISADGRTVLACFDQHIAVFDVPSARKVGHLVGHEARISAVSVSADGSTAFTLDRNGNPIVWDLPACTVRHRLESDHVMYFRAALSPDGARAAGVGWGQRARLYDARTGSLVAVLDHDGPLMGLNITDDGSRVISASGQGTVAVHDARDGARLALSPVSRPNTDALLKPGGGRIISVGFDEAVRVLEAETLRQVATLTEFGQPLATAGFSRDGDRLVTASADGIIRVWDTLSVRERWLRLQAQQPAAASAKSDHAASPVVGERQAAP